MGCQMIHGLSEAQAREVMDSLRLRLLYLEIGFEVRETPGRKENLPRVTRPQVGHSYRRFRARTQREWKPLLLWVQMPE